MKTILLSVAAILLSPIMVTSQERLQKHTEPILRVNFDSDIKDENYAFKGDSYSFIKGVDGQALSLRPENGFNTLSLEELSLNQTKSFTLQFWVKTTSVNPTVFLSQKNFANKGMTAQLNSGWALYSSNGTFAWNIGSGKRRLTYERDNGAKMPLNDGQWHQLTMTFDKILKEVRLYYDGHNKAIYKVNFDFDNTQPIRIGAAQNGFDYQNHILPEIEDGASQLQVLVDEFNSLEMEDLKDEEFLSLIVEPKALFDAKFNNIDSGNTRLIEKLKEYNLKPINDLRSKLLSNPYTIHQIREFTEIKPLNKIYALKRGKVTIDKIEAQKYTQKEQLFPSDFDMDGLSIWETALNADEVLYSYQKHRKTKAFKSKKKLSDLTIGVWNIWHGGIHFTEEEHGWDSRMRIAEIIKEKNIDVILMQETYSSGDFIAAELGYYFATTSDWDYRQQGSNISVISRYPIEELEVPEEAEFMNVAAKLVLSKTQKIYAMSNWYGMNSFPTVYDFHQTSFSQSESTPILFGGDFNAVPHTDGGDSPASRKMLDNGFTDAYRSLHPDVSKYPAFTHNSGVRIDQLYYKGQGLSNQSTEVISTWPGGFPSDHFLILSKFKLGK